MKSRVFSLLQHDFDMKAGQGGGMTGDPNDPPRGNIYTAYFTAVGGLWSTMAQQGQAMAMAPYQAMLDAAATSDAFDIWSPRGHVQFCRQYPAYKYCETMVDSAFSRWSAEREVRRHKQRAPDDDTPIRSIEQEMEFLPPIVRTLTKATLLYNPMAQAMLEKFPMESDGMAAVLEMVCRNIPGEGELYKPEYNHQFLDENAKGDIVSVDGDDIVARFQQHGLEKTEFPRIILTASHARGQTLDDMRQITHGISAMARDANGRKARLRTAPANEPAQPGQTLMLFACDTEKNSGLNAAQLIRRINELRRDASGKESDGFKHMSPGAKRMAKLILKCMAEHPNQVGEINDGKSIRESLKPGERLVLREDAARVAQHFQMIGYSKGGNTVSDAMRYLVTELTAKGPRGNDLVWIYNEQEPRPISEFGTHGPRSLLRNIGLMSIAAREVGMTEHMRDCGVRRVAFNNRHDSIAFYDNYPHRPRDENWVIEGSAANLGHAPVDAMGSDTRSGYMVADRRVRHRLKEFMAPHYGKASVGHVLFDRGGEGPCVKLATSPGTSDELFLKHEKTILDAMKASGIPDARIEHNGSNIRSFTLCSGQDFFHDKLAVMKLKKAFTELRKPGVKGLVISDSILSEDLPQHLKNISISKAEDVIATKSDDPPGR